VGGPVRPSRIGQIIGDRFRIDELIGKGAMADVFRALDLHTSAYVAVKILRRQLAGDPAAKQRFEREADVQARVRHRNVAALLATGMTPHDEPYLIVELLQGKTLRGAIKDLGRVPPRTAASYAWQALQGLSAVHALGILHRDLKPANIMLEPSPGPIERVVLIDFGFATFEGGAKLTQQGTVVGSLTYIAPERLRTEPPDARSDLYAMGVILYEMLAGAPPFSGNDDFELIEQHLNADPPPLGFANGLAHTIERALRKYQDERFASAEEMAAAVEVAALALA
jgi:serine/threonine-protein kinase